MSESQILKLKAELEELEFRAEMKEKELAGLEAVTESSESAAQSVQKMMVELYEDDAFMSSFFGENPYTKAPKTSGACLLM
mmetsp:Transcript_17051/g.22093  ORF Transcript_17051/g.22093 Transcript_17051/m.22093 type:complete len:81 (-) Transcript_17051:5684-5926(-)|eukprot:CAMPEP_0197285712 /NCGR_PEP_ID=MMETSP0890-20130614/1081_1 /TAXON_ID=44058 ORGANISM="Aureoumbra lagunensis, Strain CCMP1510" /NCGR_SAMPLE_ID=MMETSP0890 /ASSEMBLY_ACC=CAM_ASM_000533 /LENGTH=80 /DNA_ID=CAMNT_0042753503 /DNA_START=50 /DNA_END=292 /DNA_ORIENTATION=+